MLLQSLLDNRRKVKDQVVVQEAHSNHNLAPTANRNNNFNLIRFLLASLVILGHSGELIQRNINREILWKFFGGTTTVAGLAVSGFFLLSGFLIVQSWHRKPNLVHFLKNRALRIYPGFIVASAISVFLVGPLAANAAQYWSQLSLPQFVKGALLLRVPTTPPVFEGSYSALANGALWTIEYEFRCYLMVALMGICGLVARRKGWLVLSGIALLLSVFPGIISRIESQVSFPFQRFLFNDPKSLAHFLALFCAGGCFYLFRDRICYKTSWACIAAFALFICFFWVKTERIAEVTLGGYILFWFAFVQTPVLERLRKLPDISYGVYLYGWPIQKLLLWWIPSISIVMLFLTAWVLSCICGLLSWHLVEHPFLSLKNAGKKPVAVT